MRLLLMLGLVSFAASSQSESKKSLRGHGHGNGQSSALPAGEPADASLTLGPRVRREIRTLTEEQREAVFAALNAMKNTSQEDGEEKYGPRFVNYDHIVVAHFRAASHPRCDQGHGGPGFLTFHRALELWIENSLVAIDPSIEGLPYWDYNIDFNTSNPRDSIMWSDDWFGENSGDPDNMNMIRNGRFSHWHVNANASAQFARFPVDPNALVQTPDVVQSYNFLRGPTNLQFASRITRSSTTCGKDSALGSPVYPMMVSVEKWQKCVDLNPEAGLVDFFLCLDHGPHGFYHPWLGGAWGASDGNCGSKQKSDSLADVVTGCMVCPKCEPGEPCLCHRNETACTYLNETNTCTKSPLAPDGLCQTCGANCADGELGANGDPWDVATSANEPSFVFHHANVDRLFSEWALNWRSSNSSPLPFSGWPTEGLCQGHNLHDVISERYPFFGSLLGWTGEDASRRLTIADMLAATVPNENSFYVYDTLMGDRDPDIANKHHSPRVLQSFV
jgi:hypothetical protein